MCPEKTRRENAVTHLMEKAEDCLDLAHTQHTIAERQHESAEKQHKSANELETNASDLDLLARELQGDAAELNGQPRSNAAQVIAPGSKAPVLRTWRSSST